MSVLANLGYPRIGRNRELKYALESYWSGKSSAKELQSVASRIRRENWQLQKEKGIHYIPSNDFSLYDQVLDISWMVGAIPQRFLPLKETLSDLDLYFAMARGWQDDEKQIAAMEMTKWFDTNYHYIVPEISSDLVFTRNDEKVLGEYNEARKLDIHARPVLLGPVTFLLLSKSSNTEEKPLKALNRLIPIYQQVLWRLAAAGAEWVQIDEPCLVLELDEETKMAYRQAYTALLEQKAPRILLTTYFGTVESSISLINELPIDGLHIDLVRAPEQLDTVLTGYPNGRIISLGLVNGRNVWRTDLNAASKLVTKAVERIGRNKIQIAPSCSLLYCPQDLEMETELDDEVKSWLAFAQQKLVELNVLDAVANGEVSRVDAILQENQRLLENRRTSSKVVNALTQQLLKDITPFDHERRSPYTKRKAIQASRLNLPFLPTTTIGSFPQTGEVRRQRSAFNRGEIDLCKYEDFLKEQIRDVIKAQEKIDLDVLVHGEFERTDMVEYFAERLKGFAFTRHGWVQSYGSRAVRPPILFGDISRPKPMTVEWSRFAQSLTQRTVKGMLTGPITILQWSFVRDDQPREMTCRQVALALRDEVHDLEAANIKIIQVDEPALREGLPLRLSERDDYLRWAVDCFKLVVGVASDETQIHTHMCYCEFGDIMPSIIRMDADVISIEASRSKMELIESSKEFIYPNDIGPGIYDIHSPRIPEQTEIVDLLEKALRVIPKERLWVNPDCGLKTRTKEEVIPALTNMVAAAQQIRQQISSR